ncbi:MAG: GNAT family N-acetyltransferase [Rhodobacteraceae bacterium]|nr:GNAT family N-acetyltransferase [Paracoccaceae bacterium]
MRWQWSDTLGASCAGGAAFQQSPDYGLAARACGARVDAAVLRDGDQVLATVQILRRRGLAALLRGPVWTEEMALADRRRALRRLARQGAVLIATPEVALPGPGIVPLLTPRHVALWDLRPDPDDLRRGLAGKWRNALTAAERRGIVAQTAPINALPQLIAAEAAQRRARGYRALPGAFTLALPPDSLRLWQWCRGGRAHALMCFVRHGPWATYHLGHAEDLARSAGAHRVMLWQAALALRAEGVRTLDLGDINTEDAIGLARFKLGTGADLRALGPTCWVLPG